MNNEYIITTVGIIIEAEWDERGKPKAHAISTYDEHEYLINEANAPGLALLKMKHQKIRVKGTLGEVINKRQVLTVTDFELISQ